MGAPSQGLGGVGLAGCDQGAARAYGLAHSPVASTGVPNQSWGPSPTPQTSAAAPDASRTPKRRLIGMDGGAMTRSRELRASTRAALRESLDLSTFEGYEAEFGPAARCNDGGTCAMVLESPCRQHTCQCCKKHRRLVTPLPASRSKGYCGRCSRREVVQGLHFVRCCFAVNVDGRSTSCGAEMLKEVFDNHWKQHRIDCVPQYEDVETDEGRSCRACTNMRPVSFFQDRDTNVSCKHCTVAKLRNNAKAAAGVRQHEPRSTSSLTESGGTPIESDPASSIGRTPSCVLETGEAMHAMRGSSTGMQRDDSCGAVVLPQPSSAPGSSITLLSPHLTRFEHVKSHELRSQPALAQGSLLTRPLPSLTFGTTTSHDQDVLADLMLDLDTDLGLDGGVPGFPLSSAPSAVPLPPPTSALRSITARRHPAPSLLPNMPQVPSMQMGQQAVDAAQAVSHLAHAHQSLTSAYASCRALSYSSRNLAHRFNLQQLCAAVQELMAECRQVQQQVQGVAQEEEMPRSSTW